MLRWSVIGVLSGAAVLGGCGTELTSGGANVRTGSATPTGAVCSDLGIVYSQASGDSPQETLEESQNDLRNKTAALGGNFVVMDMGTADRDTVAISGHALSCSSGDPAGSIAVAPATEFSVDAPTKPASAVPDTRPQTQTPEQRLRAVDDLHQKGLLTEPEYQERRKQVLDGI